MDLGELLFDTGSDITVMVISLNDVIVFELWLVLQVGSSVYEEEKEIRCNPLPLVFAKISVHTNRAMDVGIFLFVCRRKKDIKES